MIVLDASAAVELLLGTPNGKRAARRIAPDEEDLHAPHVLDLEVAQVLRRYCTAGLLPLAEAEECLDGLRDLDAMRHAHGPMLGRIWELRANVTAYDAAYLALAEALQPPLLTCDAKLSRVPGSCAVVELP